MKIFYIFTFNTKRNHLVLILLLFFNITSPMHDSHQNNSVCSLKDKALMAIQHRLKKLSISNDPQQLETIESFKNIPAELQKEIFNASYDIQGNTLFHLATLDRNHRLLEKLLTFKELNPNCVNKDHQTALHQAVQQSDPTCLIVLLKHPEVNINAIDTKQRTPLFYLNPHNTATISLFLAKKGINLKKMDINGDRVIMFLIKQYYNQYYNYRGPSHHLLPQPFLKKFTHKEFLPHLKTLFQAGAQLDEEDFQSQVIQNKTMKSIKRFVDKQLTIRPEKKEPYSITICLK